MSTQKKVDTHIQFFDLHTSTQQKRTVEIATTVATQTEATTLLQQFIKKKGVGKIPRLVLPSNCFFLSTTSYNDTTHPFHIDKKKKLLSRVKDDVRLYLFKYIAFGLQ